MPPIVLVIGLLDVFRETPDWFYAKPYGFLVAAYVILAFPYIYFSLEAGFRAIDVHTLTEASRSLGAGWLRTLARVILPNIRAAALAGALLTLAIVMGEFTIAVLAAFDTFPVYIQYINQTKAYPAAAVSLMSFGITWAADGKAVIMSAEAETSEIIRRRLFEWHGLPADASMTVGEYAEWMAARRNQLPSWFPVDNAREALGSSYPFHAYQRRKMLRRFIDTVDATGRTVLDGACGSGGNLLPIQRPNPSSTIGVDISSSMLDIARTRLQGQDVELMKTKKKPIEVAPQPVLEEV